MQIEILKIKFNGQYAFLYDSILTLLTSTVVELFNKQFSRILLEEAIQLGQSSLNRASVGEAEDRIWGKETFIDTRIVGSECNGEHLIESFGG